MSVRRMFLCAALVAALGTASAWAQPGGSSNSESESAIEAARKHYTAATEAAGRGEWDLAVREYMAAYDAKPDPVLFFHIGNAFHKRGDCDTASIYYRRFLEEAKPSEEYEKRAEELMAACAESSTEPAAADAEEKSAGAATTPAEPGSGQAPPKTPVTDGAADDAPVNEMPVESPTFLDEQPTWQRTAAWTSIGVALAFGTAGAVLGLSASSREEDIDNLIRFRDADGQPERYSGNIKERYDDLIDEGQKLEKASYVALGLAGAALGAAVIFFAVDPGSSSLDTGAALRPTLGPNHIGVAADWSF